MRGLHTSRMDVLDEKTLDEELEKLPHWQVDNNMLVTGFEFPDFLAAIDFVGEIAELAEEYQHHPNIIIEYNVVTLELYTHDAGGITQKDIDFAHALEQIDYATNPEYTD